MLAITAVLFAVHLWPEEKGRAVASQDLTSQVGPLTIVGPEHRLFRKRAQLTTFLKRAKASRSVPEVDFAVRELLLVSPGPRSSTGYSVEVLSARERSGKITVQVRERTPGVAAQVEPRVTYPYRLISLPTGDDVYVDWLGR